MEKKSPKMEWFDSLSTLGLADNLGWIYKIDGEVERVLSIGCFTSEPFALLWITDASKLVVIEKNADYINERLEEYEHLEKRIPEAFKGRSIKFINADITSVFDELEPASFNLAFCENVLYNFQDDVGRMEAAVNQIINFLRPKGVIIAVEPKYGAEFKMVESILGPMPVPISDPKDIRFVFEKFGLMKIDTEHPFWMYIYQKP